MHGRGLDLPPFVSEVESFTLVDARGALHRCSRTENAALFRLAIGGYGLFGVIATVTLRLVLRRKLRRIVEILDVETLMAGFEARIAAGFAYGDFQFATDPAGARLPAARRVLVLRARVRRDADSRRPARAVGRTTGSGS